MDDDEWVRRLRHVASRPESRDESPRAANGIVLRTASSADVASTLRVLAERLAALEADVAELRRRHDTLVADVAEAVIERLDARWGRALDDI